MKSQQQLIEMVSAYEKEKEAHLDFQHEIIVAINQYSYCAVRSMPQATDWHTRYDKAWDEQHKWQRKLDAEAFMLCKELKKFFKSKNDIRSMLEVHLLEQDLKYCKQNQFFAHPSFEVIFEQLAGSD